LGVVEHRYGRCLVLRTVVATVVVVVVAVVVVVDKVLWATKCLVLTVRSAAV
jgi:hypothetical protein